MRVHKTMKIPLSLFATDIRAEDEILNVKIEGRHLIIEMLTEVPDDQGAIVLTEEEYRAELEQGRNPFG